MTQNLLHTKDTFFGKTAAMLGGDKGRSSMQKLLLHIMFRLRCCFPFCVFFVFRYTKRFWG